MFGYGLKKSDNKPLDLKINQPSHPDPLPFVAGDDKETVET